MFITTVTYAVVTTMISIDNNYLRIHFIRNQNFSEFQYLMTAVFQKSIPFCASRAWTQHPGRVMSILQMRFWDFDLIRPRDNPFWQFEQCLVVQKSPILPLVPLKRIKNICEMAKIFIFARAQWYQILLLEFKSILNVIAWHQFIYCSIRCYESVEFYLAKRWLLQWQYNTFNFV